MKYPETIAIGEEPIPLEYRSLLILVGPSGSGKSTLARKHFARHTRVSTDECRAMICNSPLNQRVSDDAFALFYTIIDMRCKNGYPVVADSTALRRKYRQRLVEIARSYQFSTVLLLCDLPQQVCVKRDSKRRYRVGKDVLDKQFDALAKTKEELRDEQYDQVIVCNSPLQQQQLSFRYTNSTVEVSGQKSFDFIGDVNGCYDELVELLEKLGYQHAETGYYQHREGRKAVFLGDICGYGSDNIKVFQLVQAMWKNQSAYYIAGDQCAKLVEHFVENSSATKEITKAIGEINALSLAQKERFVDGFRQMFTQAPPYLLLDEGRLVATHAGILGRWIGVVDDRIRNFCLYGPSPPKDWVADYHGKTSIVYSHMPVPEAIWRNNTINMNLGVADGEKICALRYPEKTIVTVSVHTTDVR